MLENIVDRDISQKANSAIGGTASSVLIEGYPVGYLLHIFLSQYENQISRSFDSLTTICRMIPSSTTQRLKGH